MPPRGSVVCPMPRAWTAPDAAEVRAAVERLYGPEGSWAASLAVPQTRELHTPAQAETLQRFEVDRLWLDEAIERGVPTPRADYPKPERARAAG